MLQAFLKLIAITLGVLILATGGVVFVRWLGLQQAFKAPPHPWFERAQWNIWQANLPELCAGQNVDKLVPNSDWIVGLTLQRAGEEWQIPCAKPIAIEKYLAGQEHRDWLIHLKATDTWSLDQLVAALAPFDNQKHFAIQADSQKVSVYLRKKAPEWLFAADSASLLRFRLFESLWIDTAMDFWPDFVITGYGEPFHLDERGAAELQRRQKRVVWNDSTGRGAPAEIPMQGLMTTRPAGTPTHP